MSDYAIMNAEFPGIRAEETYIADTVRALDALGMNQHNTLACVGLCRDEICQPFFIRLQQAWGNPFDLSGLAGLVFAGATAFGAASHHAPDGDDCRRYVFYVLTHIGLSRHGVWGGCIRPGMHSPSSACGALVAFERQWAAGALDLALDMDDLEYSLLKRRLAQRLPAGQPADLLAITRHTHEAIVEDLEHMIARVLDPARNDYAVFTGIQVHLHDGNDHVWPGVSRATVAGRSMVLPI